MSDLLQRVALAAGEIGSLEKDRKNLHQGYDYLSENAVKKATRNAMVKHGILPDHILFDVTASEWRRGKQGELNHVTMRCRLLWGPLTNPHSEVQGYGSGQDYGDKAIMKAQTTALREALKSRFSIATGQDPEADPVGDEPSAGFQPLVHPADEGSFPQRDDSPGGRKAARAYAAVTAGNDLPPPRPRSSPPPVPRPSARATHQAGGPAERRPPNGGGWVPTVPYGSDRGLRIDDPKVSLRSLNFMLERSYSSVDPESQYYKPQYEERERRFIAALEAERARRAGAGREPGGDGPDDSGYPQNPDDDMPF